MLFERIKLEDDEELVQVVRKHWWIIVSQSLGVFFMALLPLLIFQFIIWIPALDNFAIDENLNSIFANYGGQIMFVYLLWLLSLWITFVNFLTDHYLDLWAVTTRRVVLVDQRGFFRRFISSFRLERLQDMNIEVNGFLATVLDFGTIEAQTAGGSNEEFTSRYMPKPREIKATIVRCADELTSTQAERIQTMKQQGL